MTTILANVIGVGGVAIIALGLWGLYVLMVGELRLREYILTIQIIAVGFVLIGLAQALRLLLALVALQQSHQKRSSLVNRVIKAAPHYNQQRAAGYTDFQS